MEKKLLKAVYKIEFLHRYVPRFRSMSIDEISQKEVLFIREEMTRGWLIINQGQLNNFIYLIVIGKVNLKYNRFGMQTLRKGSIFGIEGISDCSYEAASKEVIVFKIKQNHFVKHFPGEPLSALTSHALMQRAWLKQQLELLNYMEDHNKLTCKTNL